MMAGSIGRRAILAAFFLTLIVWPADRPVANTMRVAAIVNDEVISGYDLDQRMRLVISTAGIQASPEMVSRIQPQVLRALVEERLQLQEARKQEIKVEDKEIESALSAIAQQNNMTAAQITTFLARSDINVATLKDQIRAEIAWNKLVNERFGARVFVSDDDVKAESERMAESLAQPQYLVAEIFLGIDNPDQEDDVRRTASRLIDELQRGAPFSSVAQQFSQSATAAAGGDLGWLQKGTLDPALDRAIESMLPGQISSPVRTPGGYHILFLRSKREGGGVEGPTVSRVSLKQIVAPLPRNANANAIQAASARVRAAASQVRGCATVERAASGDPALVASDLGKMPLEQIAPFFRNAVLSLPVGQPSDPIRGPAGIHVIVICEREMKPGTSEKVAMPTSTDIENRLFNQQLSMISRRYLRDLRRDAVIEYR